jgi:putative heme-binding domain-containing protein
MKKFLQFCLAVFGLAVLVHADLGGGFIEFCDGASCCMQETSDEIEQTAKDERAVEVMLRIQNLDLSAKPKLKETLLRHLNRIKGTQRYLELVDHFRLTDVADELVQLALTHANDNLGAHATKLLVRFNLLDSIKQKFADKTLEEGVRLAALQVLAQSSDIGFETQFQEIVHSSESLAIRSEAIRGLSKSKTGQHWLLTQIESQNLGESLSFTVSNVLLSSQFAEIRTAASQSIRLPETKDGKPIPPLAELVAMSGDASVGKQVFANEGTCAKCHKVKGEGKEVGPDLSEIGTKLSREAMFTSILNPSEGISHGFENFLVELENGKVESGLMISKTDESVTIKNAESNVTTYPLVEVINIEKQPNSLMPDGLQRNLTVQQLVDMVDFLMTLKKVN